MKISTLYFLPLIGILVFNTPPANSSQGSLDYCQKATDKIRYYTSLRKRGGTAKSMEKWKQQRKKYKMRFADHDCKKLKDKLRN